MNCVFPLVFCLTFLNLVLIRPAFGGKCGLSNAERIVGGEETKKLEYPWQVLFEFSLEHRRDKSMNFPSMCGGSLIDESWILTAAHCFDPGYPYTKRLLNLTLVAGEHDTRTIDGNEVFMKPKNVFVHRDWDKDLGLNDIAMIEVSEKLNFAPRQKQSHLMPICLPIKGLDVQRDKCFASGWGLTVEAKDDSLSKVLMHVKLPILSDEECDKIWPGFFYEPSKHNEHNFCAGDIRGGHDTCQGDSGGPLQCPLMNGAFILKGITSAGAGCAEEGKSGIYTKVEDFLPWIKDVKAGKVKKHDKLGLWT